MAYAIIVLTPAIGADMIPPSVHEYFADNVKDIQLQSSDSLLLSRYCWELDLRTDRVALDMLISAAQKAGGTYRYVITEEQLKWMHT
jgi:hypothetical protein